MNSQCNVTDASINQTYPTIDYDKIFANCLFNNNNLTNPARPSSPDKITETAFKLIFYFVAAIEDFLLLYVIYKDPLNRFRNAPTYFISNLMAADLVSIISGLSGAIFQLNPEKSLHNQEIAGCFAGIGVQCSFLIMMIFAADRHMAIVHPYKYQDIMARKVVIITLIFFPWCFAIIVLPVIYFSPVFKHGKALTNLFAGNIIALTIMSITIHPITQQKFKAKLREHAKSSCINKQVLTENLKVSKLLTTTALIISVCLITFELPYLIAFCFSTTGCDSCFLNHAFLSFWQYYPLLTALRLVTNSVVYAWRLPFYRKSLKLTIFSPCNHSRRISTVDQRRAGNKTTEIQKPDEQTQSVSLSQSNISIEEGNDKSIPMKEVSDNACPPIDIEQ